MIKLTATGQPFGETPSIAPDKAGSWIMKQYLKIIEADTDLQQAIQETITMARACLVSTEELAALLMQALEGELIPGLSKDDTLILLTKAVENAYKTYENEVSKGKD